MIVFFYNTLKLWIYIKINTVVWNSKLIKKMSPFGKLQIMHKAGRQKEILCHIVQDDSGFHCDIV